MDFKQLYVSAVAFLAVFVMLTILAGLMSLLTRLFPGKPAERKTRKQSRRPMSGEPDLELTAAVSVAVAAAIPGGRVTMIEEVK